MFKSLFKHSFVYGVAGVLHNAANLILLPLFTVYLTVGEYGTLEILIVSISIMTRFLHLGLGSALFKYFSYGSVDESSYKRNKTIISTSLYFVLFFSGLVILVGIIFKKNISVILFKNPDYNSLILLMLIISFFELTYVIPTSYLRIQNKSITYSIINLAKFILQVVLIMTALIMFKSGLKGILIARVSVAIIFAGIFFWTLKSYIIPKFSISILKELLSYSIYLVPVSAGSLILMMSNRYFILMYKGSEELGIFSVANRISMILLIAIMSFQTAWPSIMFRIKDHSNAKKYYSNIISYFVFIFGFLALIISVFAKEITLLLSNEKFMQSSSLIPLLSLSYLLYGLFYVGTVGINIFKKTYYLAIAMIFGAGINILANIILTPRYGSWGAALSLLLSFGCVGFSALYFSQKVYYIKIEMTRIIKYFVIIGLSFLFINITAVDTILFSLILKCSVIFIIVPIFVYYGGILNMEEKFNIKNSFVKLKKYVML